MENSLTTIAAHYVKVINNFKRRFDVQNGSALAYREGQSLDGNFKLEDKPKNLGEGLTTTGFCVSASQALLFDKTFQMLLQSRQAIAKLISIDIKEQYYGQCYNGSQNKWHTAILVKDSEINFVVDITCGQFGNYFIGKPIWDFQTWEKSLRSPIDKHVITDFAENELTYSPLYKNVENSEMTLIKVVNLMHSITTITDDERKFMGDFLIDKIEIINNKLLTGNLNNFDFKYMDNVNHLLKNFKFSTTEEQYHIMQFANEKSAKNWIGNLLKNDNILQQYILTSNTLKANCDYFGIDFNEVNIESQKDKYFVVLKFKTCQGPNIEFMTNLKLCIPCGLKIILEPKNDIYNGGKDLSIDTYNMLKRTNTIMINCEL